jgi:regulatory subunit for Cdc7p protein kinase
VFLVLLPCTDPLQHIVSRKHRKFAENDENWTQLDALLTQLERLPRI